MSIKPVTIVIIFVLCTYFRVFPVSIKTGRWNFTDFSNKSPPVRHIQL